MRIKAFTYYDYIDWGIKKDEKADDAEYYDIGFKNFHEAYVTIIRPN